MKKSQAPLWIVATIFSLLNLGNLAPLLSEEVADSKATVTQTQKVYSSLLNSLDFEPKERNEVIEILTIYETLIQAQAKDMQDKISHYKIEAEMTFRELEEKIQKAAKDSGVETEKLEEIIKKLKDLINNKYHKVALEEVKEIDHIKHKCNKTTERIKKFVNKLSKKSKKSSK